MGSFNLDKYDFFSKCNIYVDGIKGYDIGI